MYTQLATARPDPASLHWNILLWGLLGGAATAGIAGEWFFLTRNKRADEGGRFMALPAAGQWKLSDSWASNLTAIITTLAAVAAIFSRDLTDVFDHRAPVVFSLTTAIMLVFAALAPIGYAVHQQSPPQNQKGRTSTSGDQGEEKKEEELTGTWTGWCLAAGTTLFAVEGSLAAAIGVVHDLHGAEWSVKLGADAVIVVIGVFLLRYAIRTYEVMRDVSKAGGKAKGLSGIVTISCCSSDPSLTRIRMTML
jgi:hypothetical protein